ncbi:MAG TPA: MraY family glycosyltransferase [Abditibacteriaceae bacterium]|jgi:UDP-GlcNAc:undecaprenyl-phosphate GlcNAc-1-phosphate transferase
MLAPLKGSPIAAFIAAFLMALLITPVVRALAFKCGALAHPGGRRTHDKPMPQWGGLAIFAGVVVAALLWRQPGVAEARLLAPSNTPLLIEQTRQTLHLSTVFFGCGALILLLGMADDKWELPAWAKFGCQILIVYLMWRGNVRIQTLPFTAGTQVLADWQSLLLTEFWALILMNGINFIDGVDGLASGVCAIAAGSLAVIEVLQNATWAAAAAAAVSGACFGFLRWNFPPAKIYLGDTGALLIGFWLAAIAIAASAKTAAATALGVPMLVLGIPVADTIWAVIRRTLAKQAPWKADRGHLHHRLLERGFTPRKISLLMYAISATLGAAAILAVWHSR